MTADMSRPVANPLVVLREEFDDWAVLYNPDTAAAFGTNPVGVVIWKLVDGKRTADDIAAEIRGQFSGGTADTVARDVAGFLDELRERGFIGSETGSDG